jgi:hypothetical protein
MLTAAYAFFAVAQAALAAWALSLYRRRPSVGALTLLLPIAAVVYDNTAVSLGSLIGHGPLLEALSFPRFLGHAVLTPIWIVTAVAFATRSGGFQGRKRAFARGSWVLYALMVAVGLVNSVLLLSYEPVIQEDLVYYTNGGGLPGPPLPSITMTLVVIALGAVVGRRVRWPWMLGGALFMLVAAAVPSEVAGFVISNSGEVVMAASLVATERFLQRREAEGDGVDRVRVTAES